jgi:HK97 gp10 family phage protein
MVRPEMSVKVVGLDRLRDKLAELPEDIRRGAEAAVAATVDAVADLAREAAPIGETGELRDSIQGEVSGLSGTVGATADYASFVEFGTSKMSERPYLWPAGEQGRKILAEQLAEHVPGELPK